MADGPPVRIIRIAGGQTQLRKLVRAGEQDTGYQRVMPVAPTGDPVQRLGDPAGIADAREGARGDERLLDGLARARHRRPMDGVAVAVCTGAAVDRVRADAGECLCASALTAKSVWPWMAHWSR